MHKKPPDHPLLNSKIIYEWIRLINTWTRNTWLPVGNANMYRGIYWLHVILIVSLCLYWWAYINTAKWGMYPWGSWHHIGDTRGEACIFCNLDHPQLSLQFQYFVGMYEIREYSGLLYYIENMYNLIIYIAFFALFIAHDFLFGRVPYSHNGLIFCLMCFFD